MFGLKESSEIKWINAPLALLCTFAFIINPLSLLGVINLIWASYHGTVIYRYYKKKQRKRIIWTTKNDY